MSSAPQLPAESVAAGWRGVMLRAANATDWIVALLGQIIVIGVGTVLLGLLTANVVARYAFASGGFTFAQELPERMFPVFIMAGVVLAVQKGGHMAVETVLGMLNREGARALLLVGHAIVIVSYIVLCREVLRLAEISTIDRSPVLGLPSSYGYFTMAVGILGVIVTTTALAVRVALIGPEAMPTPAPEEQIA